jgi:hypothetical protein
MSADEYTRAMRYEMLVRNAYDCPSAMRNGAHLSFMENAMTMERGETYAKHLGSFDKQFKKVKTYLSKALIKLTKTKPYSSEKVFFADLNDKIEPSNSTDQLMEIVNLGLDKVIEIRKN